MILVGRYDSPFVSRVAIALHHHGFPFERRILSVYGDFDEMLRVNPLGKVPCLILDDGETLFDSGAIIDYIEGMVDSGKRLVPAAEPDRHTILKIEAVGIGLAEKVNARALESRRSAGTSDLKWQARLDLQIGSAIAWLEALAPNPWFHGAAFSRADLAVAVAVRYLAKVRQEFDGPVILEALQDHLERCERLDSFRKVRSSDG